MILLILMLLLFCTDVFDIDVVVFYFINHSRCYLLFLAMELYVLYLIMFLSIRMFRVILESEFKITICS